MVNTEWKVNRDNTVNTWAFVRTLVRLGLASERVQL
jgi:hypothetical protein